MNLISVSSKGQIVIPSAVRARLGIVAGTRLALTEAEDGVLLRVAGRFPGSTVAQTRGMLAGARDDQLSSEEAISTMLVEDDDSTKSVRVRERVRATGTVQR